MVPGEASASSPASVTVYSSSPQDPNLTLTLSANESNGTMFQDWTIMLQATGSYVISEEINGTWIILLKGYSSGSYSVQEVFTSSRVTVSVVISNENYTWANTRIVGFLASIYVSSVAVTSSLAGSSQILTVHSGQQGVLMFPTWTVNMESDLNETYSIELNGGLVSEGFVSGSRSVSFNVSEKVVSVTVVLGQKTYTFPGEIIASVPLDMYYGGAPPAPLEYTTSEYEYGIARAFVASLFAIFASLLTVRKYVLEKEKREVLNI